MRLFSRTIKTLGLVIGGRGIKTTNPLLTSVNFGKDKSIVVISKSHTPIMNWPETKLGPIGAVNPRYPLPGHVGLLENIKKSIVKLVPATQNLPQTPSHHHSVILDQAEHYLEESDVEFNSLIPDIDFEHLRCSVCACPQLLKADLSSLFPSKDFTSAKMTTIIFRHHANDEKSVDDICYVNELFVNSAIDICTSLNNMGYWADFTRPDSGVPYVGFHTEPGIWKKLAGLPHFGFTVDKDGCCKVVRNRHQDGQHFIGLIFTDAPKDHPILAHLSSVH